MLFCHYRDIPETFTFCEHTVVNRLCQHVWRYTRSWECNLLKAISSTLLETVVLFQNFCKKKLKKTVSFDVIYDFWQIGFRFLENTIFQLNWKNSFVFYFCKKSNISRLPEVCENFFVQANSYFKIFKSFSWKKPWISDILVSFAIQNWINTPKLAQVSAAPMAQNTYRTELNLMFVKKRIVFWHKFMNFSWNCKKT